MTVSLQLHHRTMFPMVPILKMKAHQLLQILTSSPVRFVFHVYIKYIYYLILQLMSQYPTIDINVVATTFIQTQSSVSGKQRRQTRYAE